MDQQLSGSDEARVGTLDAIQRRVLWLAVYMVHHANRVRPNPDGIKVGGHQASSASVVTILTELYLEFLEPGDMVSIKPHASPAFHAVQYLLGNLDRSYLNQLRSLHGLEAYPSRTKDPDAVDFSTGSVGLGSVAPNFAALSADYVSAHFGRNGRRRRFISLLGDAELDEGSIWEAVAEPSLEGISNVIWIVDLNRQSLDRVIPGIRAERWRGMFRSNGWTVIDAKYGTRLEEAFKMPGGDLVRDRIDAMSNEEYQRILRLPVEQVRNRLGHGPAGTTELRHVLETWSDSGLKSLVADLGGHDFRTLRTALSAAQLAGGPAVIFAYTIKGWGLPIAGDPLNHSALLTDAQIAELKGAAGIVHGHELDRFPAGSPEAEASEAAARHLYHDAHPAPTLVAKLELKPDLGVAQASGQISSQAAFSLVLAELARAQPDVAERIVTASPDVATSTSLGGWINRVGIFSRVEIEDYFSDAGPRTQSWKHGPTGRHIELGISENNLFLLLSQLGLTAELFGELLLPIGTLYDPFICRGLDALIYALYAGSRFIVVGTPSGVTLSPEGGAHQSVITPSIGLELPELVFWEPCFAKETEWILLESLQEVSRRGSSSYLRLSTKPVDQSLMRIPTDLEGREQLRNDVLRGAYRLVDRAGEAKYAPGRNVVTVAASGAMVPEAVAASDYLLVDDIFVNVVNVTSVDRLYREYHRATTAAIEAAWQGQDQTARPISVGFSERERGVPIVSVLDGHPHALAWLPSALGSPGVSLGVSGFGRSGTPSDLYREFAIDMAAIAAACAVALRRAND